MTRSVPLAVLVAAAALVSAAPAAGAVPPAIIAFPSPRVPLSVEPPLMGSPASFPVRFLGHITSAQRIRVAVDETGRPTAVIDTLRLTLRGSGDYALSIPAPVLDVRPGLGTQSDPGIRRGSIVWLGFSPGRRVLVADAVLDVRKAGPVLPVRTSLEATVDGRPLTGRERRSGSLDLRLAVRNATSVRALAFAAQADPLALADGLDRIRRAIRAGRDAPEIPIRVRGRVRARSVQAEAALEVEGELSFASGRTRGLRVEGASVVRTDGRLRIRFSRRLGDGHPLALEVRATGEALRLPPPTLRLRVTPTLRLESLDPPGASTWRGAVRAGLVERPGTRLIDVGVAAFLRLARVNQYRNFIGNPDPGVPIPANEAVFEYETTASVAPGPAPAPEPSGLGLLATVALAAGAGLAGAALLVAWAHS
ncbi:MAG: hypothetical protein H0V84_06985 [Actinobacteria bacterium]|nr:hypothetical protein [Actinomycetota bacterium]